MKPASAFISYSHRDERLINDLTDHLATLRRQSLIDDWRDRKIVAGMDWESAIDDRLETADLILLGISPFFIASDYCQGRELTRALERHRAGQARVIPVLLRPVDWEGSPVGALQALPKNAKPVTEWRNRHQAFREIVRGIREALSGEAHAIGSRSDGSSVPAEERYFLNHTSFLRPEKQGDFRARTGVNVDHHDIRVIIDADDESDLDAVDRVEYLLHHGYPEPIRVRTRRDRTDKFLLKELANGEYLLKARVYLSGRPEPLLLYRYITLWSSGPELP